jgi:hypothetical protein
MTMDDTETTSHALWLRIVRLLLGEPTLIKPGLIQFDTVFIDTVEGLYTNHATGEGGDVVTFVVDHSGRDEESALEFLARELRHNDPPPATSLPVDAEPQPEPQEPIDDVAEGEEAERPDHETEVAQESAPSVVAETVIAADEPVERNPDELWAQVEREVQAQETDGPANPPKVKPKRQRKERKQREAKPAAVARTNRVPFPAGLDVKAFTATKLRWLDDLKTDCDVSDFEERVLGHMVSQYLNRQTGTAWMGHERLAADLGRTRNGVQKALNKSVEAGRLSRLVGGGCVKGGKGATNTYTPMLLDNLEEPMAVGPSVEEQPTAVGASDKATVVDNTRQGQPTDLNVSQGEGPTAVGGSDERTANSEAWNSQQRYARLPFIESQKRGRTSVAPPADELPASGLAAPSSSDNPLKEVAEEGRRKKGSSTAAGPSSSATTRPRGTRLSADWRPTQTDIDYAEARGFSPAETDTMAEKFRNYWISKPRDATKLDWPAQWRNWVLGDEERKARRKAARKSAAKPGYLSFVSPRVATKAPPDMTDAKWLKHVSDYENRNKWNESVLGPKPSEAGCLVPQSILIARGYIEPDPDSPLPDHEAKPKDESDEAVRRENRCPSVSQPPSLILPASDSSAAGGAARRSRRRTALSHNCGKAGDVRK